MDVAIDEEAPSLAEGVGAGDSAYLAARTTDKGVYTRVRRAQIPRVMRGGKQPLVPRVGLLDWLDDKSASLPREHRR